MARLAFLMVLSLVVGACGSDASAPAAAQQTYGASVDATDAMPAVAVAAEADLYEGDRLAIDGRIATVSPDGCALQLTTEEGPPVLVTAARSDAEDCAWQVPEGEDGIAVAAGTLHVEDDTLRLTASGVQITPVRFEESNS